MKWLSAFAPIAAVLLLARSAGGDAPPGHYVVGTQTALDTKTNLRWQRVSSAGVQWQTALQTCTNITLDGENGYRLPTVRELESLYDPRAASGPVWDKSVFSAEVETLAAGEHWAANEDGTYAYIVSFIPTSDVYMGTMQKTAYVGARCVKGP